MDSFHLGRGSRYQTLAESQTSDFELVNTEYPSPEPVFSTPEPIYGFQPFEDRAPLNGYSDSKDYLDSKGFSDLRGWSGSSKSPTQDGVIRKIRSRISLMKEGEIFGKSKGRPQTLKSWFLFWSGVFVCLAWCAPAIALIVLNATNYVVGASAWCPSGYCPGIPVNTNESLADLTARADHQTHDFIGALQFVAKAMEVWFVYIAVTFVYLVTSVLARSEHGLPIGYLLTYIEFTDLLSILKPAHWTSAHLIDDKDPYKEKRRIRKFYIFAIGVALLCVLSNLIGPGTAVLMIPTVQWIASNPTYPQRFTSLASAVPPQNNNSLPVCNDTQLAQKQYWCTGGGYGSYDVSLDSMIEYLYSQGDQNYLAHGNLSNYVAPPSQEKALALQFNVTAITGGNRTNTVWAPSRQTIRQLSQDQEDYYDTINTPNSEYAGLDNSIALNLQRQGPVIGITTTQFAGPMTNTIVDQDREIHCYHFWYWDANDDIYAKCFRAGTGWNTSSTISVFYTGTEESGWGSIEEYGEPWPVRVTSYYSDNATFILTDWDNGNLTAPPCFPNGTLSSTANCDWDSIFFAPPPAAVPANYTQYKGNAFMMESVILNDTSQAFVIESYSVVGFTTYAVDVTNSSYSSSFGVVSLSDLPDMSKTTPVIMDSSWYLATWSVQNDTDASYYRYSSRVIRNTVSGLYDSLMTNGTLDWTTWDPNFWSTTSLYTLLQAASLLPYDTTNPAADGLSLSATDTYHPQLGKNWNQQAYAFGIDSRTSILGMVVTSLAIVICIARAVLSVWTRVRHREPIELLVAAMKHRHNSEFEGCGESERKMAKVRFGIRDGAEDQILFEKK